MDAEIFKAAIVYINLYDFQSDSNLLPMDFSEVLFYNSCFRRISIKKGHCLAFEIRIILHGHDKCNFDARSMNANTELDNQNFSLHFVYFFFAIETTESDTKFGQKGNPATNKD